jgi:VWFA-related protein
MRNAVTDSQADTGAAFGQDDGEFNIFNTDRQLAALQTAAQMLARLNEKKALVYFASGLRPERRRQPGAVAGDHQFRDSRRRFLLARRRARAHRHASSWRRHPWILGRHLHVHRRRREHAGRQSRALQDTLYALGADTGGKALLDFNDLSMGIVQAQKSVSSYYIIGYYTTNDKLDGNSIASKSRFPTTREPPSDYRQGYFAGKVFTKFTQADKERQLEDALMLGDPSPS